MTLHFTIKADAYNGNHQIFISNCKAVTTGGVTVPMAVPQAGAITVSGGQAEKINPVVTWPTVSPILYGQSFKDAISGGMGEGAFSVEDAEVIPELSEAPYIKLVNFTPNNTEIYNKLTQPVEIIVNKNTLEKSTSASMSVPLEGMTTEMTAGESLAPQLAADDVANIILGLDLDNMEYSISIDGGQTYGDYTSFGQPNLSGNKIIKVRFIDPVSVDAEFMFTPNNGDVNGDGIIDVSDVIMSSEIAGGYNYTPEQVLRANVSSKIDMTVDISDVMLISERVSGSKTPFPVELPPYNIQIDVAPVIYQPNLSLSEVLLPTGLSWEASETLISVPGGSYAINYIPSGYTESMTQYVQVTVDKADPVVVWPAPIATYSTGLKLSDFSLENGFAWVEPDTLLSISEGSYTMTYTPADTGNYNTLTRDVQVIVNETPQYFTITSGAGEPGDTVSLVVKINDVKNLKGVQGIVHYDPESFELSETSGVIRTADAGFSSIWIEKINNYAGFFGFACGGENAYDSTETIQPVIAILNFTIKSDAYNGEHQISITDFKASGTGGTAISLGTPQLAAITVTGGWPEQLTQTENSLATTATIDDLVTTSTAAIYYGDINGDGEIDITDVIMAAEIAVGSAGYTGDQMTLADVNGSETVDISDVVLIAERAVGSTTTFPVEIVDTITGLTLSNTSSLSQTYGATREVTFTATPTPSTKVDLNTIEWYVNDIEQSTVGQYFRYTPTNAGTYTISVKVSNNASATVSSKTITVSKADPTITWATVSAITYGQTFGSAVSGGSGNGVFTIQNASDVPPVAGSPYTKTLTFTPYDTTNYNVKTKSVSVIVNKADPVVTWPTIQPVTYSLGLKLSSISLPTRFSWVSPNTSLYVPGSSYRMKYTPSDTLNYNPIFKYVYVEVVNQQAVELPYNATQTLLANDSISSKTGRPSKLYAFNATAGQEIKIIMQSNDFDSYLRLLNSNKNELTYDDDSYGNPNAKIVYEIENDGLYYVEATQYNTATDLGDFTIHISDPLSYTEITLPYSETLSLTSADHLSINNTYGKGYVFNGVSGQQVTIIMSSNDLDCTLFLLDSNELELTSNDDDIKEFHDSGITYTIENNGRYYIQATQYVNDGPQEGSYTISIKTTTPQTILTTPLDGRPISNQYLNNLVRMGGDKFYAVSEGLDSGPDSPYDSPNTDWSWGNSSTVRDELYYEVQAKHDSNTSVIINASSYVTNGMVGSRIPTFYNDSNISSALGDLDTLTSNYTNPRYYVHIAMPRVSPEYRGFQWGTYLDDSGVICDQTIPGLKAYYDDFYNINDSEGETIPFREAIREWGYVQNKKYETNNLAGWEQQFLTDFNYYYVDDTRAPYKLNGKSLPNVHRQLFADASDVMKEMIDRVHDNSIDELVISVEDLELPDFIWSISPNSVKYSWSRTYLETGLADGTETGVYDGHKDIESVMDYHNSIFPSEPNSLTQAKAGMGKNINYIFGTDEIPQLIYARDLTRRTKTATNFNTNYTSGVVSTGHSYLEVQNNVGRYDVVSSKKVIDRRIAFVNRAIDNYNDYDSEFDISSIQDKSVNLYVANSDVTGLLPQSTTQGFAEDVYADYSQGVNVGVLDLATNKVDFGLFKSLSLFGDSNSYNSISQLACYSGWNTVGNSSGLGIAQAHVLHTMDNIVDTYAQLKKKASWHSQLLAQHMLEDALYNTKIKEAIGDNVIHNDSDDLIDILNCASETYDFNNNKPGGRYWVLRHFEETNAPMRINKLNYYYNPSKAEVNTAYNPWDRTFECFVETKFPTSEMIALP